MSSDGTLAGILAAVIIFLFLLGVRSCQRSTRDEYSDIKWNYGKCELCEGNLSYQSSSPETRYSYAKHYYMCEECQHVEEFSKLMR